MTSEPTELPSRAWYRTRRAWIIATAVLSLILVILICLPYGIQFGLADLLKQHGARQVQIRNIDFNPFTGRLLFEGVTAESDRDGPLRLSRLELVLGWRELFSKRARVEAVALRGLEATVDLSDPAKLWVSGLSFPLSAAPTASSTSADARPWGFALDRVELRECALTLRQDASVVDLELTRLALQRVISWQLQEVADISLEAKVNGAPLVAELRANLFDVTRSIEGAIGLQAFDLSALQPLLKAPEGLVVEGHLSLQQNFKLALSPTNLVSWEVDGLLQGEELRIVTSQFESRDHTSQWQGKSTGSWSSQEGPRLRVDGGLKLEGLVLQRHRLQADLATLQWQGELSLLPGESTVALSAKGEGALAGLRLTEREEGAQLAALERLELTGVSLSPDVRLVATGVKLQGMGLGSTTGDQVDPLLQVETLSFATVSFAEPSGLSIGLMEQRGMQARLSLNKGGQLNLLGFAEQLQRATMPAEMGDAGKRPEATEAAAMPVKIDQLVWQGKNHATFTDLSVQPAFHIDLDVKQFSLSDIDSGRPGRPSPFRFTGSTGRHAEIAAEGKITLFQSQSTGQLKGRLHGIELLPLSSYTVPAIGYHLDSGELDAEIELTLEQGRLRGNNHLIIQRLEVSKAKESEAAKLEDKISMPLDTALGMLQDKHQTIDIELPISGKLDDPNFELGDVINTALGNALKKGAMTYLTTALFPYGTMVALLKMAGEAAAAVQLNPVEFEPAAALLDEKDRDYLGKVAQVLEERPKLAIKLCGAAVPSDREELAKLMAAQEKGKRPQKEGEEKQAALPQVSDDELLALAKHRAEVIEDYLVTQHGVSASRAAVCRPVIDPKSEAVPRVDLQI